MKKISLEPVQRASVAHYMGHVREGRSAETWRVVLQRNPKAAYLKLTDNPRQIIAELAAAQLGRALKLPVPRPFLVEVRRDRLPADSRWHGKGAVFGFASQSAGDRAVSFAVLLNSGEDQPLTQWRDYDTTAVFDEWIANDDRNPGNLLYDPETRSFWLIDHGHAFTGELWRLWGLSDPGVAVGNKLLAIRQPKTYASHRQLLETANAFLLRCKTLTLEELDQDGHYGMIDAACGAEELAAFAQQRIYQTQALLCRKLNIEMAF